MSVESICADLGIPSEWLVACMRFESGLNPKARNPQTGATGLIQFMPDTARMLGTSVEQIALMDADQQLDLVARYFAPYKGRLKTFADTYMAILWPAAIGLPEDAVIFPPGSKAYLANRGLDVDHDGAVTKAEAASFPAKYLAAPIQIAPDVDSKPAEPIQVGGADNSNSVTRGPMPIALALLSAFGPILSNLIPQIASVFQPQGAVAQRNVKIAETLVNTITTAAGSPTLEGAIQAMQDDSSVAQQVQRAVVTHPDLMPLVELGGGIQAARQANADNKTPLSKDRAFLISCMLLGLVALVVVSVIFKSPWFAEWTADNRTTVLQSILMALVAVSSFFLGSSWGSAKKDEALTQKG